ncbi:MAG TPA: PIN domain-containing protein [Pyrinomonadaceae bacterium]|jgi:predicted nucleic acid-binding protein|nr:PIN domain-containing protein [Pyrinomonadaceae bacterium]
MIYLIDTNILLRSIQTDDPSYGHARRAVAALIDQDHQLSVVAQNLIEFWAVATRPRESNGLALSIAETAAHVTSFQQTFKLLLDTPAIFSEWERLVQLHSVSGRQAHDARLVAAMLVHNASHLLTFNVADFKRFQEITVVDPKAVQ